MGTESDILQKISDLYKELATEPLGRFEFGAIAKPSRYRYFQNDHNILDYAAQLKSEYNLDYIQEVNIEQLAHTCEKEVSIVESVYENAIAQCAAKVRWSELESKMRKSNNQIYIDIFSVFTKSRN